MSKTRLVSVAAAEATRAATEGGVMDTSETVTGRGERAPAGGGGDGLGYSHVNSEKTMPGRRFPHGLFCG